MNKKIAVLGASLVGNTIATDLSRQHSVTAIDLNEDRLNKLSQHPEIKTIQADLKDDRKLKELVKESDLVIGAVPGFMGFQVMKNVIEAGRNMVDISFMPEDFMQLETLAQKHRVTVVADCGVAPGMGNIILGHHANKMEVNSYECLVGGLPVIREWPYEYKAVFSPVDVIEEYTRPARYVQNYEPVIREALSEPELVNFDEIGTLESWNSDGLRSLVKTMKKIPNMIEKTLRYPGCIEYLRVLRDSGFFSYEPVEINGTHIRPIDLTAKLLFPKWQLKQGEEDFTVMRITIEGTENGRLINYRYNLHDRYDRKTKTSSMARTTGYTCNATANLILDNAFNKIGVNPPENVGGNAGNLSYILKYLKERGVVYNVTNQ